MHYAVLRKEVKMPCSGGELTLKVGGVYQIEFSDIADAITYRSMDLSEAVPEAYGHWYKMSTNALEYFTKPSKDLNAVIEESFMVCEAAYC